MTFTVSTRIFCVSCSTTQVLTPRSMGGSGRLSTTPSLMRLSRFDEVEFGRAGRDAAAILGIGSVERLSCPYLKTSQSAHQSRGRRRRPRRLAWEAGDVCPARASSRSRQLRGVAVRDGGRFPKYMRLSPAECDMAALGAMHSHCFDFFDVVVIFVVSSPKPRSGKTRLLRLVARIVPKKLFISGSGAATAFIIRVIEMYGPNVFLDEFDNIMKGNPEAAEAFRGVLNSAFDRESAVTGKCVPTEQGHMPRTFSLWAPYWIGGLKKPPETVEDRAIIFKLRRKLPGDKVRPSAS